MCLIFIITFIRNYSVMYETKSALVSTSIVLLVAASFCIYQAYTGKKVGHFFDSKSDEAEVFNLKSHKLQIF